MKVHLTHEEQETLVSCEGCDVHLPMAAAWPDVENPIYLCARCVVPVVVREKDAETKSLRAAVTRVKADLLSLQRDLAQEGRPTRLLGQCLEDLDGTWEV